MLFFKKNIFVSISLCLFNLCALGQQKNIDSLKTVLIKSKEDTNKVNTLNTLAYALRNSSSQDSCIALSKQALLLSENLKWEMGIGKSYNNLQWFYLLKSDFAASLKYAFKALDHWNNIYKRTNSNKKKLIEKEISRAYAAIGGVYNDMGDKKALKYFSKAIKIEEKNNDIDGLSVHYGYMGAFYLVQLKDYKLALDYYSKALKICAKLGEKNRASFWLGNSGDALVGLANLKINSLIKQDSLRMEAMQFYLNALKITVELNNKRYRSILLLRIGELLTAMGKFSEAEAYLNESIGISHEINNLSNIKEAEKALSSLYEITGQVKPAFEHYKIWVELEDSLNSEENAKDLTIVEFKYEQDKKDALAKKEEEYKERIAADEIKKQKLVAFFIGIALLLVLIIVIIIFRSLRIARRQKKIIENQIQIVEHHQKEIIDSINYAKRLQEAILPPQEFVNTHIDNNFILYKPKDIVAGDFYWAEKVDDSFFIAAADSTGHGVPGALVSVVCSNALNRSLKEFKLTETGKILDKTRELVLETFEKSSSEVKDGMDISLLSIDSKNKKIFWSGANNPLWYIQNEQLKEIKADKQPIGKTDYPKPFTTHQIEFKENITFYLFTDGLADQFGGPNGKKFKYKQFSDLLLKNNMLSQKLQAEIINKAFSNWKGDLEQVDDVCIIGIKI